MWSELGYQKRDILVTRVTEARDDQTKAKQQFTSTLDQLKALTNFDGGKLEEEYKKMKASYDTCVTRADTLNKKVASVDKVAKDMFDEWTKELDQYSDANLRANSEQKLNASKARYDKLHTAMVTSVAKMQPVLNRFHDVVLTLNDSLNSAAINSMQGTTVEVGGDVQNLIKDMNTSIDEANAFIDSMNKS